MKIVITGHTCGIGNAAYNSLKEDGHEIIGLSRSNGHDISDVAGVLRTILEINPDVFINNAFFPKSQTSLLRGVYEHWKNEKKLIINVCSVAALIPLDHPDYIMPYASDKREQKQFCDNVNFNYSKANFLKTKCKLTNLSFDYVKTDFKSKHDKRKYPNLKSDDVAYIMRFVINNFNRDICFREISFHSTSSPEIE